MGKELKDALDDLCDSFNHVGTGIGHFYTLGGFVHILSVMALVVLAINLIQRRRVW